MERPERRPVRLKGYDYSSNAAYFVTICTHNRQELLSTIAVGEGLCALPVLTLTAIGQEVARSIQHINSAYPTVSVDKYIIMPNHVHLLITLVPTGGHRGPPLPKLIGQFKSYTTHKFGKPLWQRSFYDHIVRNEEDYRSIWNYIDTNPVNWANDCFYGNPPHL